MNKNNVVIINRSTGLPVAGVINGIPMLYPIQQVFLLAGNYAPTHLRSIEVGRYSFQQDGSLRLAQAFICRPPVGEGPMTRNNPSSNWVFNVLSNPEIKPGAYRTNFLGGKNVGFAPISPIKIKEALIPLEATIQPGLRWIYGEPVENGKEISVKNSTLRKMIEGIIFSEIKNCGLRNNEEAKKLALTISKLALARSEGLDDEIFTQHSVAIATEAERFEKEDFYSSVERTLGAVSLVQKGDTSTVWVLPTKLGESPTNTRHFMTCISTTPIWVNEGVSPFLNPKVEMPRKNTIVPDHLGWFTATAGMEEVEKACL